MALWRANCWINLISICEIQTESQIRRKWPPHSFRSRSPRHSSPTPQNGLRGLAPSARTPVPTNPHCCIWLAPLPPWTIHIDLRHLPWVLTHLLVGVALKSFHWFQCSGFVSTAHCTRKKGAYSLSTSLSSRGCSWSKHARRAGYARGMDGSNSAAFSACLQKGNFGHNSEFHRNMVWAVSPLP